MIRRKNKVTLFQCLSLTALFLFALVLQGVHQINNPAKAPVECHDSNNHIHQSPEHHSCDLCDYKINSNDLLIHNTHEIMWTVITGTVESEQVVLVGCLQSHLRGPPTLS